MDAIAKTKSLKRVDLPVSALVPNPLNPNAMKPRAFDLLVDNMQVTGITDPILVRPLPVTESGEQLYRIIGGHHRWEGAKYLGFDVVPCTVLDDPDFTDELEEAQLVRMNVIRGKMDPQKFVDLYSRLAGKYSDDVLQELYGFADEAEFKKLVSATSKQLPKELQGKFKEAAKEVKTIDDLAKLLNTIFTMHGDSLPYGYMVVDYGGRDSIWLRVDTATMKACYVVGDLCRQNKVTMDDLFGGVMQAVAKGDLKEFAAELIAKAPKVEMPAGLQTLPTKDNLGALEVLD